MSFIVTMSRDDRDEILRRLEIIRPTGCACSVLPAGESCCLCHQDAILAILRRARLEVAQDVDAAGLRVAFTELRDNVHQRSCSDIFGCVDRCRAASKALGTHAPPLGSEPPGDGWERLAWHKAEHHGFTDKLADGRLVVTLRLMPDDELLVFRRREGEPKR